MSFDGEFFRWTKGTPTKKKPRQRQRRKLVAQTSSWREYIAAQDTRQQALIDPRDHPPSPPPSVRKTSRGIRFSVTQQRNFQRWRQTHHLKDTTATRRQFLRHMAQVKRPQVVVRKDPLPDFEDFDWNDVYLHAIQLPDGRYSVQTMADNVARRKRGKRSKRITNKQWRHDWSKLRRVVPREISAPTGDAIRDAKSKADYALHRAEIRAMNTGTQEDVEYAELLARQYEKSFGKVPDFELGDNMDRRRFHGKQTSGADPPRIWSTVRTIRHRFAGFIKRIRGESSRDIIVDKPKSAMHPRHPQKTKRIRWRDYET